MASPDLDGQALAKAALSEVGSQSATFSAGELAAFRLGRKVAQRPSAVTAEDLDALVDHFTARGALEIIWCLCLCHYFIRVAEALQLPVERDNIFGDTDLTSRPSERP
jgi:alkylhydroperoxidase family enzyme